MPLTSKFVRHLLLLIVVPLLMGAAAAFAQSCKQPMAAALSRRLKVIYVEKGQEGAVARKLSAEIVSPRSWKLPAISTSTAEGMEQPVTAAMSKAMTVELIPNDGPIPEGAIAGLKGGRIPGPNEIIVVYKHSECSEQIAAKNVECHKMGDFWVSTTSQAFKKCEAVQTDSMCTERWKSTHTVSIWRDAQCTVLKRKISEAEMRCD